MIRRLTSAVPICRFSRCSPKRVDAEVTWLRCVLVTTARAGVAGGDLHHMSSPSILLDLPWVVDRRSTSWTGNRIRAVVAICCAMSDGGYGAPT